MNLVPLVDSEPSWCVTETGRHGMGVIFKCPLHEHCYLAAWFANPTDGGPMRPPNPDNPKWNTRWQRSGETFETLTLTPSILVYEKDEKTTHWHGFITNGQVVTV